MVLQEMKENLEGEFSMYHIFVDLEMQEIERKNKILSNGLKQEVIEFGAVAFDDKMHQVGSFKSYVKPQFSSRMRKKFIDLTGITDSMILSANDFRTVLKDFCNWCLNYSDIRVYEWSDSDLVQILIECKKKGIELSEEEQLVLDDWRDVQKMYGDMLETRKQIALETAVWTFGETFKGKIHDALWDAQNTASVYALLQNEDNVDLAKQMLHHGTPEKQITYTLGDLFDFSKLQLAVV